MSAIEANDFCVSELIRLNKELRAKEDELKLYREVVEAINIYVDSCESYGDELEFEQVYKILSNLKGAKDDV